MNTFFPKLNNVIGCAKHDRVTTQHFSLFRTSWSKSDSSSNDSSSGGSYSSNNKIATNNVTKQLHMLQKDEIRENKNKNKNNENYMVMRLPG